MKIMQLKVVAAVTLGLVSVGTVAGIHASPSINSTHKIAAAGPPLTRAITPGIGSSKKLTPSEQLESLTLTQPFDLRYRVVCSRVESKTLMDKLIEDEKRTLQGAISQGQEQAAANTRKFIALEHVIPSPIKVGEQTIDVSYRDSKLLYNSVGDKSNDAVIITDGVKTFTLTKHNDSVEIKSGFPLNAIYPLAAVGLPFVPLIKDITPATSSQNGLSKFAGNVIYFGTSWDGINFLPGEAYVGRSGDKLQVKNVSIVVKGGLGDKWEFSKFRQFEGHWIASQMRFTEYLYNEPWTIYDFTLISVSEQPLSADQFQPETWLKNGTVISDYTQSSRFNLSFMPGNGSLDQQLEHVRQLESSGVRH